MVASSRDAEQSDFDAVIAVLGDAFADDPLMAHFFATAPQGVNAATRTFFAILLGARLALGMPAIVLEQNGAILGAAMGYDTTRLDWPAPFTAQWHALEHAVPGFAPGVAAYDAATAAYVPEGDHYYLGVIGVRPSVQRTGSGRTLLNAFCARSQADPKSGGVYLETASAGSLQFYLSNGFELRGEGKLGAVTLWCLFQPAK